MKMKLNLQVIQRLAKSAATFGALFTMVMSPVAMGREAQRITVKQLQQGLEEAGLTKPLTVGEFYAKNKHLIPDRVRKEFEPFVATYKNHLMPHFEVLSSKGTDGIEVATLRVTQGKELVTVQMLGESDHYAKIQNTYVSEIDVINFNDMFKRILAGDEKYRKQYEDITSSPQSSKGKYTGFPDLTVAAWQGMSQKERAAYMINMRLLWNDARHVLIEADKRNSKSRRTSSIDSSTVEKWDHFFAMFSPGVEAAGNTKAKSVKPTAVVAPKRAAKDISGDQFSAITQGKASSTFVSGSNCLVAGYISKYSSTKCSVENIDSNYKNSPIVEAANNSCVLSKGPGAIACNPNLYGTPGGNPICIGKSDPALQIATHYDGPCDTASRLGSKIEFLKDENLKNGDRYKDSNRTLNDQELEEKYKQEQAKDPAIVENFLNDLLAFGSRLEENGKGIAKIDFKKPLTDDSLNALLKIKEVFDKDIKNAKESCELATANKNNEKNFWGACDQLHRRFLNVAQFLENTPGCKDGSKINPNNLKCTCSSGTEVLPGTACGSQQPPPACGNEGTAKPEKQQCVPGAPPASASGDKSQAKKDCDEKYPGANGLDDQCNCPGGKPPTLATSVGEGGPEHYSCMARGTDPTKKPPGECGFLCKLGEVAKDVLFPIAVTVGVVYALGKIFTPKRPTLQAPKDICPNGSTAPCAQVCSNAVQVSINGVCQCAACPVGQAITSASTCTCSSSGSSTTTYYTCPDGMTKVTDSTLATCPKTNYTCWDGSTVTNPLNCPEKPSTTNKSSTGKSNK